MSLRKRMFRSNMTIIFLSLLSLLAVVVFVLILFEDSIERRFFIMEQAKLDSGVSQAVSLMENAGTKDMDQLERELGVMGYEAALIQKEEVIAGSSDEKLLELAGSLDTEYLQKEKAEIFFFRNATIVVKYVPEEDMSMMAVHFSEGNSLKTSLLNSSRTLLWALVFVCTGAIGVLLLISSYFTKRMNQVVMEPLGQLVEGAERIRRGNLTENICYQGEEEFEHLCQAFNSMQETILEDQEQRIRTEKARTDMVTGISHDLRTPLTSVQGYIKGVMDGVADTQEKRTRYLRTAYESTEDMNRLLQKLFDFSRLESGQMPFHMVKVDLPELVDTCVAQREIQTDSDSVKFCFHREEGIPEVLLDVEQFRRIFDNLFENSVKYTKACPVKIEIKIFSVENDVKLEWKDNGPGVPAAQLDRIFERFYRCDASRNQKGSGIGLYVVKYIMERHGGSIQAENEEGLKLTLAFPVPEEGEQNG